jgi:hypothetical protein
MKRRSFLGYLLSSSVLSFLPFKGRAKHFGDPNSSMLNSRAWHHGSPVLGCASGILHDDSTSGFTPANPALQKRIYTPFDEEWELP